MAKRCAIQMDPPATFKFATDSTIRLGLEAQARGYELFHYPPSALCFQNGKVSARACPIRFFDNADQFFETGEPLQLNLREVDAVLMRQDPPFDMSYISATHLLEYLAPDTLVTNDPFHVRNAPEKLLVNQFPEFLPPTLVTADPEAIVAFRHEYKDIVIKPLYGYAGSSVFRLKEGDSNLGALLELFFAQSKEPLIAQQFLPEVKQGDKRIILVDGEVAGAMARVPSENEIRANFRVGGTAAKTELTPRQKAICEALKPELKKRGLLFVGIDVIGDYLTEINVTSPTGIPAMNRLYGLKVEAQVWDAIEKKL